MCVATTARRSRRTLRAHGEAANLERLTPNLPAIMLTDNGAIKRGADGGTNDAIFPVGFCHAHVDAANLERLTPNLPAIMLTDNGAIKRGADGGTNDAIFPVGFCHAHVD